MVQKEKEFTMSIGKKLNFVDGETIQSSSSVFSGLMTADECAQIKKEEKRRQELLLYQLPTVFVSV